MELQKTRRRKASAAKTAVSAPEISSAGQPAPREAGRDAPMTVSRPDRVAPLPFGQLERDSYASTAMAEVIDRSLHATVARLTAGLSPSAMMAVYFDWAAHLGGAPGKQAQLVQKAAKKSIRFWNYLLRCAGHPEGTEYCIQPLPQDRRFRDPRWQRWPFNLIHQAFLLEQQWWHNATTGIAGVSAPHERAMEFGARQWLDIFSPSNFLPTNPEILEETFKRGGANLVQGWQNFMEDWERAVSGRPPPDAEAFQVGKQVAVTPGKVVFRNHLIELIQYEAATDKVHAEPVLIVPAWIMKYYILDLSPENSLVRYLTEQGHTVFMISWKNPGPEDRDLGMDDYLESGAMAALDIVEEILPDRGIHGVGYCLGGTLLAIAAATLGRARDNRLKSLSLLAAQTDFSEAGELMLFINESQISFLEDMMWEQGFLDAKQMAGAFQMLRSNDLVWSRLQHDYLMGRRRPLTDLMAWNADATRMPYRMHSEYLRSLFLHNDLAEDRYQVGGRPVRLSDIRVPTFCVGTSRDHISPWRSVYIIHLLTDSEVTFLLTNGGHNTGIVSAPGRDGRRFQIATRRHDDPWLDPDEWAAAAPWREGSWWPAWQAWLKDHSGEQVPPPAIGSVNEKFRPICDAPGSYVRIK